MALKRTAWQSGTVVLLEPDGAARFERRAPRSGFDGIDSMAEPRVRDFFVDEANARLFVACEWERGESWRTFALPSGEPELDLRPAAAMPARATARPRRARDRAAASAPQRARRAARPGVRSPAF